MPEITCYDGSLAESYDQCPDIGQEWDPAIGIGIDPETGLIGEGVLGDEWVEPAWWDNPETDPDEHALYIYQLAGGQATTGMDFDAFWTEYGEDFTTWETSGYGARYENVLKQLGMLNTSIELASERFNIDLDSLNLQRHAKVETALTQKEDIGGQMESQFIETGGVVSGRSIEKAEAVSENITQALGMEFRGINIENDLLQHAYKGELVDIEDRKIDYENELIRLEDDYEKHLFDLVNMMDIEKIDCETGEVQCSDGTCAATENECPGYGCTDTDADNYNPDAVTNDGSCTYGITPSDEEQIITTEEDITDETYCTQVCTPYANAYGAGGMTCYDSCLGTPTPQSEFDPKLLDWRDREELESDCDGTLEWDYGQKAFICHPASTTPDCGYWHHYSNGCCRHNTTLACK